MTPAADLPTWLALLVGFFVLLGAALTLTGAIGLLRLGSFYDRMHAPTLGTSWGAGGIIVGSIVLFSFLQSRPILHELLIGVFVTVTTPVTLMLLARAALYRDRAEGSSAVPSAVQAPGGPGGDEETSAKDPGPVVCSPDG